MEKLVFKINGIKINELREAPKFTQIFPIVQKIVKNKKVVGHELMNDFGLLKVDVNESQIQMRDLSDPNFFIK